MSKQKDKKDFDINFDWKLGDILRFLVPISCIFLIVPIGRKFGEIGALICIFISIFFWCGFHYAFRDKGLEGVLFLIVIYILGGLAIIGSIVFVSLSIYYFLHGEFFTLIKLLPFTLLCLWFAKKMTDG